MKAIIRPLAVIVALAPGVAFSQSCTVNRTPWEWWDNLAQDDDQTSGPGTYPQTYTYWLTQGAVTFTNTDIDIGLGPSGEGETQIVNQNQGGSGIFGIAQTWSGTTNCTTLVGTSVLYNTNCNFTTVKADSGKITLNDFYLSDPNFIAANAPRNAIQHEIGHVLGMAHSSSGCTSFMRALWQPGTPTVLQSWEVSWMNSTY